MSEYTKNNINLKWKWKKWKKRGGGVKLCWNKFKLLNWSRSTRLISEMQERETIDQVRSKMYKDIKRFAVKRVQKAPDFCQVQIITFLTRMPAKMSIGRHLMRLQLFQGISFMNHTLWWSDFERRIWGNIQPNFGNARILGAYGP